MNITYTLVGDYYLPNIAISPIPTEEKITLLGRYARMRRAFLKKFRPIEYSKLLLSEQLFSRLREVDSAARTRLDAIGDREIAHEVILSELVCC